MEFTRLFQPGKIAGLEVKNRMIMAPMGTHLAEDDGVVGDRLRNYYRERARGGVGAIMVEASFPTTGRPNRVCLADDRFIPGLKRLTDTIRAGGARPFIQIHPGRGRQDTVEPVSSVRGLNPQTGLMARGLRTEEVEQRVYEFGEAVSRARESGFDAVQLHAGHGYLLADFLSARVNQRTDKYGGSQENRFRIVMEMIRAAKSRAGEDYPILIRLSVDEIGGYLPLDDIIVVCKAVEQAGFAAIDVTAGGLDSPERIALPYYFEPGFNTRFSQHMKKAVSIPVSVAGRVNDPRVADDILKQGKADFVTMGRALIADPEFPNKSAAGKLGSIRKCVACGECANVQRGITLKCTVNAGIGREGTSLEPASAPKKVLVIGSGPAGMEAARVAAGRGHNVALWERAEKLGGQVNLAAVPPHKLNLTDVVRYLANQLEETGVQVQSGKAADLTTILDYKPDVVVAATGCVPKQLALQGVGTDNARVVSAYDVLSGKARVGQKVVILGNGTIACETADLLATEGKEVNLVGKHPRFASDAPQVVSQLLLARLEEQGVRIFAGIGDQELTETGLKIKDREGRLILLDADTIVTAIGTLPDNTLAKSLEGRVPALYVIGDCVEPRKIMDAIGEGAAVGAEI